MVAVDIDCPHHICERKTALHLTPTADTNMPSIQFDVCRYAALLLLILSGVVNGNAAAGLQTVQDQEAVLKRWLGHFQGMTRQQVVQEIGPPAVEDTSMATGEPRLHLLYHTSAGGDLSFRFVADGTVAVVAYSLIIR
jgi:hypothetical protein